MNVLLREREIMLNPVLGAYSLHSFIKSFTSKSKLQKVTMWHLVTVLPLVFHKVSRNAILKRRGGLRSILNRDPQNDIAQNETIFNLNNRIQNMNERTFRSIDYALSFKLIKLIDGYFIPYTEFSIPDNVNQETSNILKSAEKLGLWAAELTIFEYLTVLGVRP